MGSHYRMRRVKGCDKTTQQLWVTDDPRWTRQTRRAASSSPPPTTQSVCSVLLSDENFDPRFQVNVVAVVARDTIVPAHQSVTVDTNLVFNQINNFAVYFSALPVFLNVSNDVPYTPKNDYFLKPQNQMRLRVNLINASDTDFSLAESTTLGNVILFPYENFSQHYAN